MKLLIIGDSLSIFGGVPNYTRPLFKYFRDLKIDTSYFYTSSYLKNYSFFRRNKIVSHGNGVYEYINCPLMAKNFKNPSMETKNKEIETEFSKFISENAFTHIHIHSMLGLPSSIFHIIKNQNIKLFVTVHEYWWLCPHRVMVDYNKRICEGPTNMQKCAFCVSQKQTNKSDNYIKLISKFKHDFPKIFEYAEEVKTIIIKSNNQKSLVYKNINFRNLDYTNYKNPKLEEQLKQRLDANISALNLCDKIIAVSTDVKDILIKYGVDPEKILIQHIGSTIAKKTINHTKKVNPNEISFGFIGGVGYYKGVHQLVEAFLKLPSELKCKAKLKIFGKYSQGYYNAIEQDLLNKYEGKDRITFYGKYVPDDIQNITNQIDIIILPSLCADTAPQTIFESFSAGLPIIAPNIGGFPDFITDMKNGIIYEAANVNSLKNALIKIIENPELIDLFQKNIPKNKTISENVKELVDLYKGIIA